MSCRKLILAALLLALLAGCGGGGGDSGSDDAAVIDADNTLEYGQAAINSINGLASAGEGLEGVFGGVGMASSGKPGVVETRKSRADETIECAGGGSISIDSSDASGEEQTVHFEANQCVDEFGGTMHGEMTVSIGPWDEFPSGGIEMVMETGNAGFANTGCEFNGGLIMRFYVEQATDAYGENRFVYEHGATSEGFISFCPPDFEQNIAGNTLVRNEFTYAYNASGGMTSSNSVSVEGGFEAPDGSGYVSVTATDLEYGVSESGESLYGDETSCPVSGQVTITGGNDSTASIYFGDDAPPGYAVQVIGPDGYVAEFESCAAFLGAAS